MISNSGIFSKTAEMKPTNKQFLTPEFTLNQSAKIGLNKSSQFSRHDSPDTIHIGNKSWYYSRNKWNQKLINKCIQQGKKTKEQSYQIKKNKNVGITSNIVTTGHFENCSIRNTLINGGQFNID